MDSSGYFTRLAAVLTACALLGFLMMRPDAGERAVEHAVEQVAALTPEPAPMAARNCARGEAPLTAPFAAIDDIISISPLGAITAPGEPSPAPHLRINTHKDAPLFKRRTTTALAPARADITAIERRMLRTASGEKISSWTVHFTICGAIKFHYDRLDALDADILKRAGGLIAFTEINGAGHLALKTQMRVNRGDTIGESDGFDIGLYDLNAQSTTLIRPERYRANPYAPVHSAATDIGLLEAVAPDRSKARCALDYLDAEFQEIWTAKLGDAQGLRRGQGEDACRTALVDIPGAAQGAWFTDSSHNAATTKVSAIALAPDTINQTRLTFSLHGRVKSLTPELIRLDASRTEERTAAAKDFFSFNVGEDRVNTPFALVKQDIVYCYQQLRANFAGPEMRGVMLLQISTDENGAALMKLEARSDALSCAQLAPPWSFTGAETTFYR